MNTDVYFARGNHRGTVAVIHTCVLHKWSKQLKMEADNEDDDELVIFTSSYPVSTIVGVCHPSLWWLILSFDSTVTNRNYSSLSFIAAMAAQKGVWKFSLLHCCGRALTTFTVPPLSARWCTARDGTRTTSHCIRVHAVLLRKNAVVEMCVVIIIPVIHKPAAVIYGPLGCFSPHCS